jgi:hypothetical protein
VAGCNAQECRALLAQLLGPIFGPGWRLVHGPWMRSCMQPSVHACMHAYRWQWCQPMVGSVHVP